MSETLRPHVQDEWTERELKKQERKRRSAPVLVAVFVQDHTERVSSTERGRIIRDLPDDEDLVLRFADSFAIVLEQDDPDLDNYCKKIHANVQPDELRALAADLEQVAVAIDPSRAPQLPPDTLPQA